MYSCTHSDIEFRSYHKICNRWKDSCELHCSLKMYGEFFKTSGNS